MSTALSTADEARAILSGLVGGARYGVKIRFPHALVMTLLFRRDLTTRQKLRTVIKLVWEHASNLASFVTIYKSLLLTLKVMSRWLRQVPREDDGCDDPSHANLWRAVGRWILHVIVDGPLAMKRQRDWQRPCTPPGHPEHTYHSFVAGAVGGYFVWGRYSAVNQQIVLYLASRVLLGLWNRVLQERQQRQHGLETVVASSSRSLQRGHGTSKSYPFLAAVIWGVVMALWEESPNVLQSSLKKSMDEIYRHDSFQSCTHRNVDSAVTRLV